MADDGVLEVVPDAHRAAVGDALDAAFGPSGATAVRPVAGGASGRNDPFVDLAGLGAHLGPTPELEGALLRAWLGREPDDLVGARLVLAAQLGRLFAGCILLLVVVDPATPVHHDLSSMSIAEFTRRVASGELVPGVPATTHAFAKLALASFVEHMHEPATVRALAVAHGA